MDWFETFEEEMEFRYKRGDLFPRILFLLLTLAAVTAGWIVAAFIFSL